MVELVAFECLTSKTFFYGSLKELTLSFNSQLPAYLQIIWVSMYTQLCILTRPSLLSFLYPKNHIESDINY